MRKSNIVICAVCGFETNTHGMATHLKDTHTLSVDDYVKMHGEYRPKQKDYGERAKHSNVKCSICNESMASERHLSFHVKKIHSISKHDYIVDCVLKGKIPLCKCGCGQEVTIKDRGSYPYWNEYISGHNAPHTHVGSVRSHESRMKMRQSAIERLKRGDSVFYRGKSNDEVEFSDYIKSQLNFDVDVICNDTQVLSGKEIDVYIPSMKLAFELNGERFHSDLYKDKLYHLNKTNECEVQGIRLIHIWLSDWLSNRDIIKSQISNILGSTKNKIYARNCEVRELDYETSRLFLQANHVQGNSVSKIRYGLFHEGVLAQVMTFGNLRKATGRNKVEGSYELIRMASLINTVVVGGATKLFKHFLKTHNPSSVISFANRDWSVGNVYNLMGMEFVGYTDVGYFYSNGKRREHRYNFQKHKLVEMGFDESKTEYEIMTDRGYYRVWNVGNIIYEWVRK